MAETTLKPSDVVNPQVQQKCPACGAPTRYDPVKGMLICEYCGTETPIAAEKPAEKAEQAEGAEESITFEGFDFQNLNDQAMDLSAENLPIYNCVSCGAEIIAPAEQIALTCPYCRNNIVLTEKVTGKLRPDGIVPFKITAKDLPAALNRFYKGKVLLPRRFFSDASMKNVTGIYVPFWIFNGRAGGRLTYNGTKVNIHRNGSYEYTETSYYTLQRDVSMNFEDIPVDASGRIDNALMDSLEPFDIKEAKPFDMRYLSGFTADRFDEAKSDIAARAEQRMYNSASSLAQSAAGTGYIGVTRRGGKLKLTLDAKYMLLPVYLFDLKFENKTYHFAVNGQSGEVVGSVPTDSKVSLVYFLIRMLGLGAAVLAGFIIKYLTGG